METQTQVQKLEQAFELLDNKPEALKGDGIAGIVADGQWCIDNIKNPEVLDAALIASAQAVEHYEMAGYGSAATWAGQIGETEVETILNEILSEEKSADEKLNALAIAKVNMQAMDEITEESAGTAPLGHMQTGNI